MKSMASSGPVFVCACLGMLLFGISLITLGSVAAPLAVKFGLDAMAAGSLFSILPVGILAGSFLFGPFCDRYGYKPILILSCALMLAGFQGLAYSTSLNMLRASVLLFGVGGGAINGATNAVVSDISGNKSANLSLLGVFFALGALGMPFVLGALEGVFSFEQVVSATGFVPGVVIALCIATRFPSPKHQKGLPFLEGLSLTRDGVLLAIGFFLFCLSSFEAIVNNWTTTYLAASLPVSAPQTLFALSLYVAGMGVMRLLLGSVLRRVSDTRVLGFSFVVLLTGIVLLHDPSGYGRAVAGLVLIGAGLAAGFPVMLGRVGSRYPGVSATAFSLVLTIALVGNMLVNFAMGVIADVYGVQQLTTVAFVLIACMAALALPILKRPKFINV